MSKPERKQAPPRRGGGVRSCVGCGERVELGRARDELIRLVFAPIEGSETDGDAESPGREASVRVVPIPSGQGPGRGAWLHGRQACLVRAVDRGFSRAARAKVVTSVDEIARAVHVMATRRAEDIVAAGARRQLVAIGRDATLKALRDEDAQIVIVATDAGRVATEGAIGRAGMAGQVVVWSTKARLGEVLRRQTVAILALKDEKLANAVVAAIGWSEGFGVPDAN